MSNPNEFDDDDSPWGEHLRNKQRNSKRVKQRRRDTKRRNYDEAPEMDFYKEDKWK
ncbi:small highly charged protein [Shewanella dokdonensis]|uniref:Small highly charged protein n=1 Tax=Shewanella dokdonensis TaxID=712036 RepID=A0ABX8DGU9_9GAMM|nr:small highly charged protein [Shewanella dokdonensis]MCL1074175.1 small highly charged protein [Shewanella dokdonensis]QVK23895.1 small highly charged protein [Shewanella dokdonensis]